METNHSELFETLIHQKSNAIAEKIVELQYNLQPDIWKAYGDEGRKISVRDAGYHLPFLSEAVVAADPSIFNEYVQWVKQLFKGLNFPDSVMRVTLECTQKALEEMLPAEMHGLFTPYIQEGIAQMDLSVNDSQSHINTTTELGKLATKYNDFLLKGDKHSAGKLIMQAVESGVSIKSIYLEVFQKSQYEIGRLWLSSKISVATEHFCSAATQSIMSQLYPYIFSTQRNGKTMIAACVGGELHEIGIRMVADFFEMNGWDTYYLGANTPTSSIIKAIEENEAHIVGLSAAMPYHRPLLRKAISDIRKSSIGVNVKILIGGNALNRDSSKWESFGADGYAPNAELAVKVAESLTVIK